MITPRRTRLVRVPDLHTFRRAIDALWHERGGEAGRSWLVVVPSRGAGEQLARRLGGDVRASLVTRDALYVELHGRLADAPRRLSDFERTALAQRAASAAAREVEDLPFRVRPALVSEILRFYDLLRRQSQHVRRFEELIEQALGGEDAGGDRGGARLLRQTRFLASTFERYESAVQASGSCDEHVLRGRLVAEPAAQPVAGVIVTVPDWIADPDGLFVADFDLLSRLPHLQHVDIVSTEAVLASGFHERIHSWWPGLDEVEPSEVLVEVPRVRPALMAPAGAPPDQPWSTVRDREEELIAVARRSIDADPATLDRIAVVFKKPLPYLYAAPEAFGAAALAFRASHGLPLAAEPSAAAVDLLIEIVETDFARTSVVGLLRSPHFRFGENDAPSRASLAALDRLLSDERYLGGLDRLEALGREWAAASHPPQAYAVARPALLLLLTICRRLTPLLTPAPASSRIETLRAFLDNDMAPLLEGDAFTPREREARRVLGDLLGQLAAAHRAHHDPDWTLADLAVAVRTAIGSETVELAAVDGPGIHLVDDQEARFGDFDDVTLVGLIEHEWPERPRRSIFYPPELMRALGWPSEKDRRAAEDARFLDLLASARRRVWVSTITLDEEALVTRSTQLDEIPRARLSIVAEEEQGPRGVLRDEALAVETPAVERLDEDARRWAVLRMTRPPAAEPLFHGRVGVQPPRSWSVSALETYLGCPFKFYAQHVLRLEEEPDDEEIMDPRRQGALVHDVFERFFRQWQAAGQGAVIPSNLDAARAMFVTVVDAALAGLPEGEAGLERTRLLGSPAAAGLGEAVFHMEAERPVPVVERLLEYRFNGALTISTTSGTRRVAVNGKADRLDLLEDGTFRLIDYKLGWPPSRARALQLPIYSLNARSELQGRHGRAWELGEAVYLAFKGPRRVVPLFTTAAERDKALAEAQQRLSDTLDAVERGEFPPTPDDVYRCETCSFAAVCRKDYVGEV